MGGYSLLLLLLLFGDCGLVICDWCLAVVYVVRFCGRY